MPDDSPKLDYRAAGVDLDAADRAKKAIKSLVASTHDRHTLSGMGSFGGMYAVPGGMDAPVLVSSADGVGTKLKVAFLSGRGGARDVRVVATDGGAPQRLTGHPAGAAAPEWAAPTTNGNRP